MIVDVFFTVPATFVENDGNETVLVGQRAVIECPVLGDNPIKIRWLRNHQFLPDDLPPRFKVRGFCCGETNVGQALFFDNFSGYILVIYCQSP